jgi:CDP-diacylglycerol--glycerol-3-phosphate 3-phosphatidyltransferase
LGEALVVSVYTLKPRFQGLLRPLVVRLATAGVSANPVTLAAAFGSLVVGAFVAVLYPVRWPFLLIPVWLFVRMALNAVDGMLAREHNQKSRLGAYLNELGDVVSDAALYAPFALFPAFGAFWIALVILLSAVSELAGVLGQVVGASRRYDGPMGRATAPRFGAPDHGSGHLTPPPDTMDPRRPRYLAARHDRQPRARRRSGRRRDRSLSPASSRARAVTAVRAGGEPPPGSSSARLFRQSRESRDFVLV